MRLIVETMDDERVLMLRAAGWTESIRTVGSYHTLFWDTKRQGWPQDPRPTDPHARELF